MIDLRVDGHRAPLTELRRLLNMFRSRELVAIAKARLMEISQALVTAHITDTFAAQPVWRYAASLAGSAAICRSARRLERRTR